MAEEPGEITVSQKEAERLNILQRVANQRLSQIEASRLLKLSTRQVRRLQKRLKDMGLKGLVSKHRGRSSNNKIPDSIKLKALELIKKNYYDFGPTFALEKLTEEHGLKLSVETLRGLMIKDGLWKKKSRKKIVTHQMRARRSSLGELIQIDGSAHDWFEGRGPKCCLLVFIDDATSRIMMMHFEEHESSQGYFDATKNYIKEHGLALAFYSDKHGIFRINMEEAKSGTGESQFGRALRELGIDLICANSPQAKGRVERANGTLQDRLVKEMRLRNISDIKAANAFLPKFIKKHNKQFAVAPASEKNMHRENKFSDEQLNLILTHQDQRKASKNLEVSYENIIYQIQTNSPSYAMRGAMIKIYNDHGKIKLSYKGQMLAYKTFDKKNRPTPVVTSKELNKEITLFKPRADHPWRRYPSREAASLGR